MSVRPSLVVITLLLSAAARAQIPSAPDVAFDVVVTDAGNGMLELTLDTTGELGALTLLGAGLDCDSLMGGLGQHNVFLPTTPTGQHFETLFPKSLVVAAHPTAFRSPDDGLFLRNYFLDDGTVVGTPLGDVVEAYVGTLRQTFEDYTPGEIEPTLPDMTITCTSNKPGGPDRWVVFDTSTPTGGDSDLVTPGTGLFNTMPLGHVIVIAENITDLDDDELVDEPDDEDLGGVLRIDFDAPVDFSRGFVLDIDPDEDAELRVYMDGVLIDSVSPSDLAKTDNNALVFNAFLQHDRIELEFGGSAALGDLLYAFTGAPD